MGFNYEAAAAKKKKKRKPDEAKEKGRSLSDVPNSDAEAYRSRAKAEQGRRRLATDASTFTCVCFESREDMGDFLALVQVPMTGGRYTFCEEFAAALDSVGYQKPKMAYRQPMRPNCEPAPNPCAGMDTSGDPERVCEAQFMALFDAMRSRKDKPCYRCAIDSPYWFAVIFESQDKRDQFLREYGFVRYGYQYIDGSKIFKNMNH